MTSFQTLLLIFLGLVIASCSESRFTSSAPKTVKPHGGDAKSEDLKPQIDEATIDASDQETANDEATIDTSDQEVTSVPVPTAQIDPEDLEVFCDWKAMTTDETVQIECRLQGKGGEPLPEDAAKSLDGAALFLADQAGKVVSSQVLGDAGMSLLGFGDFFKKVFSFSIKSVFGLFVGATLGPLGQVLAVPLVEVLAGLGAGSGFPDCLASVIFPIGCFKKFQIPIANLIPGGGASGADPSGIFPVWQFDLEGHHLYSANAVSGWRQGGVTFYLLNSPLPGTAAVYACHANQERFFVSREATCEGLGLIGLMGYVNVQSHSLSTPIYRCYMAKWNDQIVASDPAYCAAVGYSLEGIIGYAPLPGYVH